MNVKTITIRIIIIVKIFLKSGKERTSDTRRSILNFSKDMIAYKIYSLKAYESGLS